MDVASPSGKAIGCLIHARPSTLDDEGAVATQDVVKLKKKLLFGHGMRC